MTAGDADSYGTEVATFVYTVITSLEVPEEWRPVITDITHWKKLATDDGSALVIINNADNVYLVEVVF